MFDQSLLDFAGTIIYVSLAVAALYGLFTVILLVRKINQKKFASEAAAQDFLSAIRDHLKRNDFDGAAALCDTPEYWAKAVPQLVLVALANRDRSPAQLRRMLTEKFDRDVLADLEYRHSWINTIVKSAPMLGLLGTVCGMIRAFARLAVKQQEGGSQAQDLADDISLALITTALGLVVAIPLTLAGSYVRVRIGRLEDSVQTHLSEFLYDLEQTPQHG